MNSNKIQPNVGEEMVIYSQGASLMYGHTDTLPLCAHTWTYALSLFQLLIPVTSGYNRTWDETGALFLCSDWLEWTTKWFNQEWTWTELASKSDFSSVGGVGVEVILQCCLGMSRAPKMLWPYQLNPLLIQQRVQHFISAGNSSTSFKADYISIFSTLFFISRSHKGRLCNFWKKK